MTATYSYFLSKAMISAMRSSCTASSFRDLSRHDFICVSSTLSSMVLMALRAARSWVRMSTQYCPSLIMRLMPSIWPMTRLRRGCCSACDGCPDILVPLYTLWGIYPLRVYFQERDGIFNDGGEIYFETASA